MPRELNIEKLERKFSSLTRSRESIQAVSSWIMHHHEFCEAIVEQWYISLTKDLNALVMFYVANEVIQNCGKKRCPQYREAFSKVLEKAVCLEKVKEIKSEVCRVLTLWKERSYFDEAFFQSLETKLNSAEVIPSPLGAEDEVSELEIITNYKSEKLFDSLKRLMTVESEAKDKEDLLNYANEPVLPDLSDFTVRDECLGMLKKIDSFYNLLKDCFKATNSAIKARETAVKELKNSCIFYNAQHGDVKKVANAYITYGKRLRFMEKKLSEKMLVLPSPVENNSPSYSESNTQESPIGTFPFDHDTSSVSRSSNKVSPSSSNEKSHDTMLSSENMKNSTSFWNKISKNASSDFPKSLEKKLEETFENTLDRSPKHKFSKLAELFAENKSDFEKQIKSESDTLASLSETSNPSPNQLNENTSDFQIAADQLIDEPVIIANSTELSTNQESTNDLIDPVAKETSNEIENTAISEDPTDIDLMLEESYDTKKAKSNISVKRKIELLLQSKEKKICTEASKEKSIDCALRSNIPKKDNVLEIEKPSEVTVNKDNTSLNDLCDTEISDKEDKTCIESKVILPIVSSSPKEIEKTPPGDISVTENGQSDIKKDMSLEEKIQNVSNIFMPSANAIEQCKDIDFFSEPSNHELSGNDNGKNSSCVIPESNFDSKVPENDNFSSQTPSTFLDSSLFSSISSLSTEFLKNILSKNKSSTSDTAEENHVTSTSTENDTEETGKPREGKDSEELIKSPVLNPFESVPLIEDSLVSENNVAVNETPENVIKDEANVKDSGNLKITPSLDDTLIKSMDLELPNTDEPEIPKCMVTNQQRIPECTLIKPDSNIKEATSLDDGLMKSEDSKLLNKDEKEIPKGTVTNEQKNLECTVIKSEETELSSNDKKIVADSDVRTKSNDQVEIKNVDKPNLLVTLQNILECISTKTLSVHDNKHVWEAPPMSFENCLNIYHTLKSPAAKFTNVSSPLITQNVTLSKTTETTITSEVYSQDNLEVMDMECDSE